MPDTGMFEQIKKAVSGLVYKHPFWGTIALNTEFIEHDALGAAMGTDCFRTIYYDPERCKEFTYKEVVGVVLHELFHIIFLHSLRRGYRDPYLWNIACDFTINLLIKDMRHDLPKWACYDEKWRGKTPEEIYDELLKDNASDKSKSFDILLDPVNAEHATEHAKDLISKAYAIWKNSDVKMRGTMPSELEQYIKSLLESKVPWEREFHRYAGQYLSKNDYSYSPPNKRYLSFGVIAPSLRSYEIGNLVIAVDTSGSCMGKAEREAFAAETAKLASLAEDCTVITCDCAIQQVVKTNEVAAFIGNLKFKGGGGTSHKPVFEWIENNRATPELFIGLTDGCSDYPEKAPVTFPVLWCLTKNHQEPPWGRKVVIDV